MNFFRTISPPPSALGLNDWYKTLPNHVVVPDPFRSGTSFPLSSSDAFLALVFFTFPRESPLLAYRVFPQRLCSMSTRLPLERVDSFFTLVRRGGFFLLGRLLFSIPFFQRGGSPCFANFAFTLVLLSLFSNRLSFFVQMLFSLPCVVSVLLFFSVTFPLSHYPTAHRAPLSQASAKSWVDEFAYPFPPSPPLLLLT